MQNVRRRVEVGQKPLTIRKTLNPTKQNPMALKVGSSPLCCGTGAHCLVFTVVMLPMRDCGERIRSRAILYKYFKQDLSFNGTVGIMTFPRS